MKRNLLSATTLIGDKVVNANNETLGKLEEIMISLNNGRVGYAVLSFGGILGLGEKYFALPWSALKVDQDNKCLVLNMDKDKLEKAPGFDKDNWPDMTDENWGSTIHTYYNQKPFWDQ